MNSKEFLEQVRYVDRAIDTKLEQLYRLRNEATKATSLVSDMPRGGSPNLQRLEDTIVKIIDLEREINRDIDRLIDMKAAARLYPELVIDRTSLEEIMLFYVASARR